MRFALVGLFAAVALALSASLSALAETPTPATPGSATTTPTPTSLPAVIGLNVSLESVLFDANNFPLPPERQIHTAVLTWTAVPEFPGAYEVERAVLNFRSGEPRVYQRIAVIRQPDSRSVRFEDRIDLARQRCYRVRGVRGGATSPYSPEACTPIPPSFGSRPNTDDDTRTATRRQPSLPGHDECLG